ncbi:UDP-N-acetylglucosamine acyltransferase [Bordetella genomosp. 12]|uniref:UDP-N-acetylglucosamine acyltransferase n=1 Tax=Bordetella genomosp. 12 TaxID=463035 RepID=A0A261VLZ7_9BORD|nr:UDP-N-acetylglucosamine acyltransferase [Bordetella genomosp. 12]OZI74532.1 UDP-N-acetylglucosamine acyltransferase [Bordetella genomosp. 12]
MRKQILIAATCLTLTGCAAPPPLNFSTPNVGYSEKKIDAELKSMTVTLARPDEAKGEISWGMEGVPQLWDKALQEAVNRMSIFRDDAPRKVNLAVKILGLDAPGGGFSMTTKTIARYEIIDRSNGDIIFTQDVASEGTVPMGYAFLGVTRARESINRAVQNNITQFLQALETVDPSKPMFPRAAAK